MSLTPTQRKLHAANGLCTRCCTIDCTPSSPHAARPGRRSCADCADDHRLREAKASRKRKRQRLCPCGERRRYGLLTCQECADAKEIKRREVEAQLVAQGVCIKCRVNPARERKPSKRPKDMRPRNNMGTRADAYSRRYLTMCTSCAAKQRQREKAKLSARRSTAPNQRV